MPDKTAQDLAAARIIRDAGGELIGRTRLQKIAFLMKLSGFEDTFAFEYRHYGPYSEDLATAMELATYRGRVEEKIKLTDWGSRYSIYSIPEDNRTSEENLPDNEKRVAFIQKAKQISVVELELAATAAYLYEYEDIGKNGKGNPWAETQRRKPGKAADGRLARAAVAYEELRRMETVVDLPWLPLIDSGYLQSH